MKQKTITILLICLSVQLAWAQVLPKLTQQFNRGKNYFEEKIYVHVNKPSYLAGETLWFKAYNTSSTTKALTDISKVVYAEVLTEAYEAKVQLMVELTNGQGYGYMVLPESLATGNYVFRAYTNLMRNAGPGAFFEQKLTIVNAKKQQTDLFSSRVKHQITFAAEGGTLVEGISNSIAVTITDNTGKGLVVSGAIVSEKNDTLAKVKTLSSGFAKLLINPKAGQRYKFVGTTADKDILIKALPTAQPNGYSLILSDQNDAWKVLLSANTEDNIFYTVVHRGEKIIFSSENNLVNGKSDLIFKKDKFDVGLYQITIFNSKGKPVAERLFYQPREKQALISLEIPGRIYLPRQKVEVSLATLNDIGGKQKAAELSMSVFKVNQLPSGDEIDILNYMQFGSELKYKMALPEASLISSSSFNDLLISEQSKRFNWNGDWDGQLRFLPEFNGNIITGTLLETPEKPAALSPLYLNSVGNPRIFYHTRTDSLGNFKFNAGNLFGVHELIIQTNYNKDSTSVITLNSPYDERAGYLLNSTNAIVGSIDNKALEEAYFAQQVDEFYSPKPVSVRLAVQDTVMFYGAPEKKYILADYTKFNTLEDVLREYVSEVTVIKRQKGFNFRLIGGKEFFDENPLILYDGIPYFDLDKMMAVSPDEIYSLEIIRDKYYYNGETYSGIMHFRSYKANISDYYLKRNAIVIDYEGLQLTKAFPEIRYDSDEAKNSAIPNYRSAVYWNPSITVVNKTQTISFFTPDLPGRYRIVLQGISNDGNAIYEALEIEVKEDLTKR